MEFTPAKHLSIQNHVVEELKKQIVNGLYKPGDKLPSEKELCQKLQVSRTAVREAIRALAQMGVVNTLRGKGTFVSSTPGLSKDPLEFFPIVELNNLKAIYETRVLVEPLVAALAAERASDSDIARIKAEALKVHHSTSKEGLFQNHFHAAIAQATHNPILEWLLGGIERLLSANVSYLEEVTGILESSSYWHSKIYEAIAAKDSEEARRRMDQHLNEMIVRLRQVDGGREAAVKMEE